MVRTKEGDRPMDFTKAKYRHELKYVSSQMDLALIKNRLDHLIALAKALKK